MQFYKHICDISKYCLVSSGINQEQQKSVESPTLYPEVTNQQYYNNLCNYDIKYQVFLMKSVFLNVFIWYIR